MSGLRNSRIELLRILAMFGVIILHFNEDVCNAFEYITPFSTNSYILFAFEEISIIAVNLFAIITGYFSCKNREIDLKKPMMLILQVIIVKELEYLIFSIIYRDFSIKHFVGALIPNNWFIILYVAIYILSPFINKAIDSLDKKQYSMLIITMFSIFSVYAFGVDILGAIKGESIRGLSSIGISGNDGGYTIINFLLLYLLGAYIRICKPVFKNTYVAVVALLCYITIFLGAYLEFTFCKSNIMNEYCNPIVILLSLSVFYFVVSKKEFNNRIINSLGKASLMVYLVHPYFLRYVDCEFLISQFSGVLLAGVIVGICIAIYLLGWGINELFSLLFIKRMKSMKRTFKFVISTK